MQTEKVRMSEEAKRKFVCDLVSLSFLSYRFAVSSPVRAPKKRTKKVKPAARVVKHTIRKPFTCPTQVMSDDSDSDVKIVKTDVPSKKRSQVMSNDSDSDVKIVKTDVPSKKRSMYVIDQRRFSLNVILWCH